MGTNHWLTESRETYAGWLPANVQLLLVATPKIAITPYYGGMGEFALDSEKKI